MALDFTRLAANNHCYYYRGTTMDSETLPLPWPTLAPPGSAALADAVRTPLLRLDRATLFNYWEDGCIRDGLACWGELFRVAVEFDRSNHVEALRVADGLRQNGTLSIVTMDDQTLTVWVSLRSATEIAEPCP